MAQLVLRAGGGSAIVIAAHVLTFFLSVHQSLGYNTLQMYHELERLVKSGSNYKGKYITVFFPLDIWLALYVL